QSSGATSRATRAHQVAAWVATFSRPPAPAPNAENAARNVPPIALSSAIASSSATGESGIQQNKRRKPSFTAIGPRRLLVGVYFPRGSMQLTRERHYEIEDSLSYLGVAQGGEGAAQLETLACDERVGELA